MNREKVIVSWSGGKDSALTLYKLLNNPKYQVVGLLSVLFKHTDGKEYIGMYMIEKSIIKQQSEKIGIHLYTISYTDINSYQNKMHVFLEWCVSKKILHIAFGDIHLQHLRDKREQQLATVGMRAIFPLWNMQPEKIIKEFFELKFKAIIVNVDTQYLNKEILGTELNKKILDHKNIDICGENGEYHTLVYDGPIFNSAVNYKLTDTISIDSKNRFVAITSTTN